MGVSGTRGVARPSPQPLQHKLAQLRLPLLQPLATAPYYSPSPQPLLQPLLHLSPPPLTRVQPLTTPHHHSVYHIGAPALAARRRAARRPVRHPRPPARLRFRRSLTHNPNPKPNPRPSCSPSCSPSPNLNPSPSPSPSPSPNSNRLRAYVAAQGRLPRPPRWPCRASPTRWPCDDGHVSRLCQRCFCVNVVSTMLLCQRCFCVNVDRCVNEQRC